MMFVFFFFLYFFFFFFNDTPTTEIYTLSLHDALPISVNPSGLATALPVRHGSDAQRERWLPRLAEGHAVAAFSITEPQAGSDLKRIETTAQPLDGGGLRLDGEKRWVAGGVSADVVFLLVDGPSCVILPADGRDGPGWSVGEIDKVGYRG